MNNNSKKYKMTYSSLRPSDESVERTLDIMNEKKKINTPLKLAATALAVALFLLGGFGIFRSTESSSDFGILVAHAAENGLPANFKSVDELTDNEAFTFKTTLTHELEDFENYVNFDFDSLEMTADINDYSNVEEITVSCENGNLHLEYISSQTNGEETIENVATGRVSDTNGKNSLSISGADIVYSQNSPYKEKYVGNEAGYWFEWNPHYDVVQELFYNDNYDFTQINDIVTFTITYKDGSIKTSTLSFHYDSNGYMQFDK